jgi:hypothetical protein
VTAQLRLLTGRVASGPRTHRLLGRHKPLAVTHSQHFQKGEPELTGHDVVNDWVRSTVHVEHYPDKTRQVLIRFKANVFNVLGVAEYDPEREDFDRQEADEEQHDNDRDHECAALPTLDGVTAGVVVAGTEELLRLPGDGTANDAVEDAQYDEGRHKEHDDGQDGVRLLPVLVPSCSTDCHVVARVKSSDLGVRPDGERNSGDQGDQPHGRDDVETASRVTHVQCLQGMTYGKVPVTSK